jgi:glycosyltransferase involved in cell wall biosynthesis
MTTKILHIITRLDKGGSAENVIITCRKLSGPKYKSVLVYGTTALPALSIDVPVINVPSMVRSISPLKDAITLCKLVWIMFREKPDIVHTHSSKGGFLGRWSAWVYNVLLWVTGHGTQVTKIIHTPHGHVFYGYEFSELKTKIYLLLERITAPITHKLIALTNGERDESLKFGVGRPGQWEVIHSAVGVFQPNEKNEEKLRDELGISDDALIVGTVARLEPVKGVRYFVEAAVELRDREFDFPVIFLIVGDGKERNMLEKIVSENGLEDCVVFAGMREDVTDVMSIMDIYVQPSVNEGMGKTIVQAESVGLPVIATRVQGIPDAMKENVTGLIVAPKNPPLLSNAILTMIQSPLMREKMGRAGPEFVKEAVDGYPRFSTERMIYLLEKIYDKILSE